MYRTFELVPKPGTGNGTRQSLITASRCASVSEGPARAATLAMYSHTATLLFVPTSVAPQHPRLAFQDLLPSPHPTGIIRTSSRSRSRTTSLRLDPSRSTCVCGIDNLASKMSDSRVPRKNSLGRRLSKKLSGRKGDGSKAGSVVESVAEDVSGRSSQLTVGASNPEHLVILVNGIWGSVKNWVFAAKELKEKLGDKVVIHCSASNGGFKTHAGVDVMGHRLADEVMEVVEKYPGVTKISFVGHSLGGIISRYAIGQLYAPPGGRSLLQERAEARASESEAGEDHNEPPLQATISGLEKATIAGLEPINFITLATPHLGCRGNNHLPFLFGRPVLEWAAPFISPLVIGPTGRHLFLADSNKEHQPLLVRMVTDGVEGKFLSALGCFKRRIAYANVCHDRMVGWRTASIRKESEMPEPLQEPEEAQSYLKKYLYIVHEEEAPLTDKDSPVNGGSEPKDAPALDDIEEMMVAGLQQVPWHRVDVNFSKVDTLYEAHNLIQVKNPASRTEGQYVIHHIIDNYF